MFKSLANLELSSCFDAQVWAKEFCKINTASDEATMIGWFANAIMAGYDHANREIKNKTEKAVNAKIDGAANNHKFLCLECAHPCCTNRKNDPSSGCDDNTFEQHAESDENSFVRNGVKYVADFNDCACIRCHALLKDHKIYDCEKINGVSCHPQGRKDGRSCNWKRAEKKMREMTAKEIYELAHQGAAFARFIDDKYHNPCTKETAIFDIGECKGEIRYCPLSEMTDEHPSNWNWRKLETECE
jgi:hypothetical protein